MTTTEELSDKLDEVIEETGFDRGAVLEEARKLINRDRADQYGQPEDCFGLIAEFWGAYLGSHHINLTSKDVSLMMVLLKIARESHQGKRDNLVDAAGYLGLAGDM